MCYPKPGPRCSSVALASYAQAHANVIEAFKNGVRDEKLKELEAVREEARKDLSITTFSIKRYQEKLRQHPDDWFATRELSEAKALRAQRIKEAKGKNQEHPHTSDDVEQFSYETQPFLKNGDSLPAVPFNHPNLTTSMHDSERWVNSLTDKELAAVQHYTGSGYHDINAYLNNHLESAKKQKAITGNIRLLDRALRKYAPPSSPATLYRKHVLYNAEGHYMEANAKNINELFPVGGVYTTTFYHSTTLHHNEWLLADREVVNMQIISRQAVPLTVAGSHGPAEGEFLIPRGASYRVVSNDTFVKDADGKQMRLIQLEDV